MSAWAKTSQTLHGMQSFRQLGGTWTTSLYLPIKIHLELIEFTYYNGRMRDKGSSYIGNACKTACISWFLLVVEIYLFVHGKSYYFWCAARTQTNCRKMYSFKPDFKNLYVSFQWDIEENNPRFATIYLFPQGQLLNCRSPLEMLYLADHEWQSKESIIQKIKITVSDSPLELGWHA